MEGKKGSVGFSFCAVPPKAGGGCVGASLAEHAEAHAAEEAALAALTTELGAVAAPESGAAAQNRHAHEPARRVTLRKSAGRTQPARQANTSSLVPS